MFGTIREKFLSVQDGLSARGLSVGEPVRGSEIDVHLNAGATLLQKYQTLWQEMHTFSEINARQAKTIDHDIIMIRKIEMFKSKVMKSLVVKLEGVPKLIKEAEIIMNNIGAIRTTIEEIEESLIQLEDLIEQQEFDRKKSKFKKDLVESMGGENELKPQNELPENLKNS